MRSRRLGWFITTILFVALPMGVAVYLAAQDQPEMSKRPIVYVVTDLGLTSSFAEGINNRSSVGGTVSLADGVTQHAFLWRNGKETDLGTLGGANSSAFQRPSERDQVAGNAETSQPDPLGEDFCTYGTHLICLAFIWQNGAMRPLPTLGGNNSWANGGTNNRGQVVGLAENTTLDPTCAVPSLEAKPVIWEGDSIRELPTFSRDEDGTALAVNDEGQAVGASTDCGASPTIFHAVLWQKDGSVIDLGNFGGAMNNVAQGINNLGQVVGFSDLPGDTSSHAFLWTARDGMQDLGVGDGLFSSLAFGINDKGQVVGMSCNEKFDCGAFLWQNGGMTDLNLLLPNGSPWNLIAGTSINSHGEIVGVGDAGNGFHGILLTPCDAEHADIAGCNSKGTAIPQGEAGQRPRVSLPENIRKLLWKRSGVRNSEVYQQKAVLTNAPTISGPSVSLSPTTLTFSTQAIGTTSSAKVVTLKNTGTTNLTITTIAIVGTNAGDFAQTHSCGSSLTTGTSCNISVTFKPTASGTRTAALSITDNASGSPQQVPLNGTGTTAKLLPTSLNFGTVAIGTTSRSQSVTLTNVGTTTLTITGITITGTNAADFLQTHTCGSSLAAGTSCSISVTFNPTASGMRTAALSVSDNAAGSPQKVSLSGTGTTAKLIPSGLIYFGSVQIGTTSAARTVTLTNVGTTTLTITGITITTTEFLQTHTCGSSLAAGTSCSISVTFKPTQSGLRTATLSVADNASGSPQTVPLAGGCIPRGGLCYGPSGNMCCRAPYPLHSACSNRTGWGTCFWF